MKSPLSYAAMVDAELPETTAEMWGGPFVELAGDTRTAGTGGVNADAFITANLRRHLVVGPSSMPVCEGTPRYSGTHSKLLAVANGRGQDAARAGWRAVDTLADHIAHRTMWAPTMDDAAQIRLTGDIEAAFAACHESVSEKCDAVASLTAIYLNWPRAFVGHIGSTRAYLYRERRLRRITADDTVAARLDHRGIRGGPRPDGLTEALGQSDDLPAIEVSSFLLRPGDQIMLCTAGLVQAISEFEIARALTEGTTAAGACRRIVDRAIAQPTDFDVTAVVARAASETDHGA